MSVELLAMAAFTASFGFFRVHTQTLPRLHQPLLPVLFPGLTSSSSSGWQWCLGCTSWQRRRFFTKPFLSGFSPFFPRWHTPPLPGWVAGLSVIATQRWWSRDGNLHVGTRSLPAVQSGDSIRVGSVYNHTTNSDILPRAHTHTYIHTHACTHTV